jgi:aerobic carbon-monoxide dehydrogenase medium subunit
VKAGAFDYVRAASLSQALTLLAEHGDDAKLLAGGQSLLPALNLRLSVPALLIDIGRLEELRGVTLHGGVLRLGALTRHAELLTDPLVQAQAPLLARAIVHVAHPAIRSRGTLGGSLANADPAAELPACVLALQARLVLRSVRGERVVPAEAFFTGLFETALAADEVLTAVEIDAARVGSVCGFQELARRSGDYAIVGLAAQGRMEDRQLHAIQLGYFSVGARATLAPAASAALLRRPLTAPVVDEAAEALAADLEPHDDLQASAGTRLHLARVLLRRVVGEMALAA